MTFITLPLLYNNLKFNNFLKNWNFKYKDLFKIPLQVDSFAGCFPFSYWNGDLNSNYCENLPIYNDIEKIISCMQAPMRFDCSNILLKDFDLNNIYQNIVFTISNNCGNYIEISDLTIYNFLKDKYPNYLFILSKNADLIHPFNIDILNIFLEQNIFYLINLPNKYKKDLDFLKQIKNKSHIEINIANRCQCNNFQNENNCILQEQNNQINFSGKTVFQKCNYINNYLSNNLIEEIEQYKALGFTHFKIEAPPINQINLFNQYLINNLLNSKYQLNFIKSLENNNE